MHDLRAFLLNNFNVIKEKIGIACRKAGRNPQEVKLLGASKKQPPEKIAILHELGVKLFGENYVQEGEKKIKEFKDKYKDEFQSVFLSKSDQISKDLTESIDYAAYNFDREMWRCAKQSKPIREFFENSKISFCFILAIDLIP